VWRSYDNERRTQWLLRCTIVSARDAISLPIRRSPTYAVRLVPRLRRCVRIQLRPARIAIEIGSVRDPHRSVVHNRVPSASPTARWPRCRRGVYVSLFFADAGLHQPAVCAACCASRSGSGQGGNEPAGSNDRPDARNGQKAEPGQRAERATGNSTESRTSSGRLDSIIFAIEIAEGAPPRCCADDADGTKRNAASWRAY
jgi:hypothetical protein